MKKRKYDLWLAPLRGVTIRAFRDAFRDPLREAGFAGAFAPFIPANPGIRPNKRLLKDILPAPDASEDWKIVPQVISRHPEAMRVLLRSFKDAGFARADLNAGCPFPMIRKRGRGSGLMKTPDILEEMIEAGCDEMGEGNFSVKVRLGLSSPDELLSLMPIFNRYPLAILTVHARTALQMYEGDVFFDKFKEIAAVSKNKVMYNGDVLLDNITKEPYLSTVPHAFDGINSDSIMVGRNFIRNLGARPDAKELLKKYFEMSCEELNGDNPVLGRVKELLTYWNHLPRWKRLWPVVKISRTISELKSAIG